MVNTHQPIYVAANTEQANILANELIDRGIQAYVSNEALQMAAGDLPWGGPIAPRVVVHQNDAEEARRIALEFDRAGRTPLDTRTSQRSQPRKALLNAALYVAGSLLTCYLAVVLTRGTPLDILGPLTMVVLWWGTVFALGIRRIKEKHSPQDDGGDLYGGEEDEEIEEDAVDWPRCPHCDRPRHTCCPVCETAGTDFAAAYMPGAAAAVEDHEEARRKLLVICPTCDEPFAPEFPARCEWCGHRFRDGRELPQPPATTSPFADMNPRVWIVMAGLLAIIGASLAFFASIASR